MTADDIKLLIVIGAWGLFGSLRGVQLLQDKSKKNHESNICMGTNFLISGLMALFLFVIVLMHFCLNPDSHGHINNKSFALFIAFCFSLTGFVSGLHAFINKRKINNKYFLMISNSTFGASICILALLLCIYLLPNLFPK